MSGRTARVRNAILLATPLLLLAACSGGASTSDAAGSNVSMGDAAVAPPNPGVAGGAVDLSAGKAADQGSLPISQVVVTSDRKVIAVADMTVRVDDVAGKLPDIVHAATAVGGYVAGEDTSSNPDDPTKTESTLTLRVPTTSLERVMAEVRALGALLKSHQEVQDVTQQVADVESRVKSAQASVARMRILLDQANTLGQVVRIESQLANRESDLESLQAQQRVLADQTSMATLTVTVLGPTAASAPTAKDETGFLAGLSRGWNALADVVVVGLTTVGLILPFALVAAFVLVPLELFRRRRRQERGVAAEIS